MSRTTLVAVLVAIAGCGDRSAASSPTPPTTAAGTGPTARLSADNRALARRRSVEEMNRGVEAAAAGDLKTAEPLLRRAIDLDPDNHQAHYNLGILLYAKKDHRAAASYFERAIEIHDSAEYRLALGRALYDAGTYDAARVALAKAAVADPSLYEAHYYLGLIHTRAGRREQAISPLRECTRQSDAISGCFAYLAESYYELGELESAMSTAQKGLSHHPGDELMSLVLGKAQLVSGKPKQAAETLGALVAGGGGGVDAKLWWSMALSESGKRKKARGIIKQVVEALGDSAGRYDVDFARQLARKKRRADSDSVEPKDGEVAVDRLRVEFGKHFGQKLSVRGYVVWKYDCARVIGKKAAAKEPLRCSRPHINMGATKNPWPDRTLWVVDVPRPPRPDEKKAFDKETLDSWPEVPVVKVGDAVVVTGTWAEQSPRGFVNTAGLLVYESLAPAP